jgi:hypothetical protein
MFKWLLVLAAFFGWGSAHVTPPQRDYIGMVAAEAAYASLLRETSPVKPNPLVDPKNCPTCNGTGKVKTGDGHSWTKCPTCQPMTSPTKPTLPLTVPPKPEVGFPPRSPSQPVGKNCPNGACPVRVYQTLHS